MKGTGAYAEMLRQRYNVICKRLGLNERDFELDTSRFVAPVLPGQQLRLF
jgi:hypothetical protein